MASRSSSSEYQPFAPNYRLAGKANGRFGARIVVKTIDSSEGVKANMGCAPATNGDRVAGLASTAPNSSRAQKGVRARLST